MKKLTEHKKEILKDFVDFTCEICHKQKESSDLQIHRIHRGYCGGEYILRNIQVICKDCHNKFHYKEFK